MNENNFTAAEYNREGMRLFDKKDYSGAAGYFKKAAQLDPDNSSYLYNAGNALMEDVVLMHSASRNEARDYLLRAADKGSLPALFGLGKAYDPCLYEDFAATAEWRKAVNYYRSYIDGAEKSGNNKYVQTALNNIGCIYGLNRKMYREACAYTRAAGLGGLALGRKNYDYFSSHLTDQERADVEKIRTYSDICRLFGETEQSDYLSAGTDASGSATSADGKEEDRRSLEERMAELNDLVGLKEVKKEVSSLINLMQVSKVRKERGMKVMPVSMHLVFTGNPGTGKTTVARMLAGIYRELGVLSRGQLVEVDRSEMVAGYVGQTAIKTQDLVDQAKGGILFIDEAYTLTKEGNDFGQEAVDTLLKEMEDNREDLVVIAAGYTGPMETFLDPNPGLRSRFNKFIHFEDYTEDELLKIFIGMCDKSGYTLGKSVKKFVKEDFARMKKRDGDRFANGRSVRNYFEAAVVNQANRIAANLDVSDKELTVLKLADFRGIVEKDEEETETAD